METILLIVLAIIFLPLIMKLIYVMMMLVVLTLLFVSATVGELFTRLFSK